ncbi:MAG: holo-ACP synthase [Chloroflexi bacterium]|nr:holo-ACP synthase [Chloroflexota bacterium]
MRIYSGVDLIETARIADSLGKWGDRFTARVYTPAEIEYCKGSVEKLAVRFAAKEAAAKALGTGIGWGATVQWPEVEVVTGASGPPALRLYGVAAAQAERLGWTTITVSLSHSRDNAIALVVALADA